jgi:hypothetical protein
MKGTIVMPTKKQILGYIKTIGVQSTKLQARIHEVACMCLAHAEQHGDATLAQALYNELPNGQRREAVLEWIHLYSPVRIRQKGEKVGILKDTNKDYRPFDMEGAEANPYWTQDERSMFKLDAATLDFDTIVRAALIGKIKKIDQAIEKDADPDNPYTLDFDPVAAKNQLEADALSKGISLSVN